MLKKTVDFVYIHLEFIWSVLGTLVFYIMRWDIMSSKNVITLLTSAITIVSIVIALFSVLLTSVATKNSDVKNYFFSVVNKNLFNNQVKRCILYGFMNLGISLVLIMSDIVDKKIVVLLQYLWVFTSIYFVIAGYKFISLLIDLLTDERIIKNKKSGKQGISRQKEIELRENMTKKYNDDSK